MTVGQLPEHAFHPCRGHALLPDMLGILDQILAPVHELLLRLLACEQHSHCIKCEHQLHATQYLEGLFNACRHYLPQGQPAANLFPERGLSPCCQESHMHGMRAM